MQSIYHLEEACLPYLVSDRLSEAQARQDFHEITARYTEPWRHYHTTTHLADIVSFLLEHVDKLETPRTTLWAALEHDEVYMPQAPSGVNEELSAQLAESRHEHHLSAAEVARIGYFIRKTADHVWDPTDPDLAYLLDSDLKILGAPTEEFDAYDANIAKEYRFVPADAYKAARPAILDSFLRQKRLFITDIAHEMYEEQAKANLQRAIDRLATS